MTAISDFRVTQHSQIFSLFFRNRIRCIINYTIPRLCSTYDYHFRIIQFFETNPGADRYVSFCGSMFFVPALILRQPNFKAKSSMPTFRTDLYFTEIHKITISTCQCSAFFLTEACMYVCLAISVSIKSNFKPDLIFFSTHTTLLSRLSHWLTILIQQSHSCVECRESKKNDTLSSS